MSRRKRIIGGFDPEIFTQKVNMDFLCSICSCVVRKPKECSVCGTLYCDSCLKKWEDRNRNSKQKSS